MVDVYSKCRYYRYTIHGFYGMKAFVVGWVYQVISHELLLITPENLTYKALRMAKERCEY